MGVGRTCAEGDGVLVGDVGELPIQVVILQTKMVSYIIRVKRGS